MNNKFDVFVIGTGVAGGKIASALSGAGKKVGICDYKEYGGTCALTGYNPKKVLTGWAESQARLQGYKENGVITNEPTINWGNLIKHKEKFTSNVSKFKEKAFAKKNIKMFHGKGKFVAHNKLQVGDQLVEADTIIIATGATPRKLNIPGEDYVIAGEEFMSLTALPAEILFIGGGYISFELADVANQAGAKVTILERSLRSLSLFEPELVDLLTDNFNKNGIAIENDTAVVSVKKEDNKFLVEVKSGKVFTTDLVVHGAGRVAHIAELELDKSGVKTDSHGIVLNPNLQSVSNSSVYVAGDAVSNPKSFPLTPVASLEASTVIHNILNDDKKIPNYTGTASVLYTFPPVATVGMLEADAKKQGIDYLVSYADTSETLPTQRLALKISGYKIIIRKDNSQIIGAHLIGHHVDEVINLFALAIRNGFTAEQLKDNIWSYPSVSDVIDDMLKFSWA